MAKIYGQLEKASLENVSSAPSAGTTGRIYLDTVLTKVQVDDGTLIRSLIRNDQNAVLGNSGTAANNIRLHRGANGVLQFVVGSDTTAEGTLSTALNQISAKHEAYPTASKPANGNAGRQIWVSDTQVLAVDNGSVWKEITDTSTAQTLTNKTLTSPVLTTPAITGAATYADTATPSAPAAGNSKFYHKADGKFYYMNSDGVERAIGSGGSGFGGKNYAPNDGTVDGATTGYNLFTTTFTNDIPTTITPGAANLALTVETTDPLSDGGSLKLAVTTAAASAGQGMITDIMTIDDADLARVFQAHLDYLVFTGASNLDLSGTDTSTFEFWVYNVGLATWYQPNGFRGITATVPSSADMTFQTDISNTSNNNQYRLALIIKNDPAGTASVLLDSIYFGRASAVSSSSSLTFSGAIGAGQAVTANVTDIQLTASVNNGAPWTGDTYVVQEAGDYLVTGSLIVGSGTPTMGLYLNGSQVAQFSTAFSASTVLGAGAHTLGNLKAGDVISLRSNTSGNIVLAYGSVARVGGASGSLGTARDVVSRVASGSNSAYTANTPIVFDTLLEDTAGAVNLGTGAFTIPESGYYDMALAVTFDTAGASYYSVNGVAQSYFTNFSTNSTTGGAILGVKLNAGDVVTFRLTASGNFVATSAPSYDIHASIRKSAVQSNQVAADAKVACSYYANNADSGTAATGFGFVNRTYDTHSAYTPVDGKFTAPRNGYYDVKACMLYSATVQLQLFVDRGAGPVFFSQGTTGDAGEVAVVADTVYLNAGEAVIVYTTTTGSTTGGGSAEQYNFIRVTSF